MSQPNTAEENNNLRYIGISIALLVLVATICYFLLFKRRGEDTKTSTNLTTEPVRQANNEASKKEHKVETNSKESPPQDKESTFYMSLWGVLGALSVTTFTLACRKKWSVAGTSNTSFFQRVFSHIFSAEIKVTLLKAFSAWCILTLFLSCIMKGKDNMLVDICSRQNLVKNLVAIFFPCAIIWGTFYSCKVGDAQATLFEMLITVILAWMVHDIIKYLLSDRVAEPSAKLAPKLA